MMKNLPKYAYFGLVGIVLSEILMFCKVWLFWVYFTPIVWWNYILFIDGLNYALAGNSYLSKRKKEFLFMIPWSYLCWLIFEFYNIYLQNWVYIGLPQNFVLKQIGYFVSFASIFPGIFETEELLYNLGIFKSVIVKPQKIKLSHLKISIILGLICLIYPFIFPSRYIFGLVWLGFILLLEPINYFHKVRSVFREYIEGKAGLCIRLLLAGAICGLLWEFWNYWAGAKWIYKVPFTENIKIFEMPILGFIGFPPFALECFAMYNLAMIIVGPWLQKKENYIKINT